MDDLEFKGKGEHDVSSFSNHEYKHTLKRQLKQRQIAMIAIGGVIGTGLFLGTATSLKNAGPVGLLLGYIVMGSLCYSVMISLGEMIAFLPLPGGHISLAERFVSKGFSFLLGWNYWYNVIIALPAEISAASILIDYWSKTRINNAIFIAVCLVIVVTINLFGVGVYGEAEFVFASIKVITIVGLIILGIVIDLGGSPTHDRIGFRYWKNPGPFVQYHGIQGNTGKFLGWWSVASQAAFSFIGTEMVAIAAGEAKNPRRSIPKAIRAVYIRLILFYVCGVTIIGLLVPSNDPKLTGGGTAAASPFVIAINHAGIKTLPSIINAALLTSAWSAASSDLYAASRALYGLSLVGQSPKVFSKVSKRGLPYVSVMFCACFTLIAFMAVKAGPGKVFGWFQNMTAIAGLMSWFGISLTYIRFHAGWKKQGLDRNRLPFKTPFQPFAAWYAMISCGVICLFSGFSIFLKDSWDTASFVTNYLPVMIAPLVFLIASIIMQSKIIKLEDMDFVTGLAEIEADTYDEPPCKNIWESFWRKLF